MPSAVSATPGPSRRPPPNACCCTFCRVTATARSCGYAKTDHRGELSLRACVFTPDGKTVLNAHEWAGPLTPETLGTSVAVALLRQGARELIDGIAH